MTLDCPELAPSVAQATNWAFDVGDFAAVLAAIIAALSWYQAYRTRIEIRNESDRRAEFDSTIGIPLTEKLELLAGIILNFAVVAGKSGGTAEREIAVSSVQSSEHSLWYFAVDNFLQSNKTNLTDKLYIDLNTYWDRASFLIDELSNAVSPSVTKIRCRELGIAAEKFLNTARLDIQRTRSNIH